MDKVGTKLSTSWPAAVGGVGVGQQLSQGVANVIAPTEDAIGLVEDADAQQSSLQFVNAAIKRTATTTGQKPASSLGYAPLPASVVSPTYQTLPSLQTASGQAMFEATRG